MIKLTSIFCTAILWVGASTLQAGDFDEQKNDNWHQWRGPEATGVAPKGNPPAEWSATKNIKWKVAVPGRGSASPIVWGDRIFILTAVKTDRTAVPPKGTSAITSPVQLSAFGERESRGRPVNLAIAQSQQPPTDVNKDRPDPGRGGGGRFNIQAPTNYY